MILSVLTLLMTAVWMDLKTDKISNRLILFGLFLGLPYQIILNGPCGILVFLLNGCVPILFLFLFYRIKALGAGDIKLLSVLGVFLNKEQYFCTIMYIFASAAMIGVVKLLLRGVLLKRLRVLSRYARGVAETGLWIPYECGETETVYWENRIHFSVAILVGYLISIRGCYLA